MDKIKSIFKKPAEEFRRRSSVEHTSRWVGEHEGYDTRPLPRLTWKGFWMGILVSMGGFVFGYDFIAFPCPHAHTAYHVLELTHKQL